MSMQKTMCKILRHRDDQGEGMANERENLVNVLQNNVTLSLGMWREYVKRKMQSLKILKLTRVIWMKK